MSKEEIILEYIELSELYLVLDSNVKNGSIVNGSKGCTDVMAIDPTADLVILRDDIWNRLTELSQELHLIL